MNWDKKSIIAILTCIVLFTLYTTYLQRKYPEYYAGRQSAADNETAPAPTAPPSDSPVNPKSVSDSPSLGSPSEVVGELLTAEELRIETKTRIFQFDQNSGSIESVKLKNYYTDLKSKQPEELLDSPLVIQGVTQTSERTGRKGFQATREGNSISFKKVNGAWEVTQKFSLPDDGYGLDLQVSYRNISEQPQELTAGTLYQENIKLPKSGSSFFSPMPTADLRLLVYGLQGEREEKQVTDICQGGSDSVVTLSNEKLDFLGIDKHYFLVSLWAKGQATSYVIDRAAPADAERCPLALIAYQNQGVIAPGASVTVQLSGYMGPKETKSLEAFDPSLKNSLKLGWFSVLAHPLLAGVKAIHRVVGNYGIAIILVTLFLKILFYPLTRSAAISMKKMQKLQPEMNRLREKFKDDPQRQQREIMAFMGQNKVNPLKGCLPILPQIPVFIAFYNVLSEAIELRHAPFYGWLQDLAAHDPYYVTPLLLGAGMFLQQKLTPNPGMDKNQERIMLLMPIIFTVMMLSLPAGMVLYMMTNTVVSIAQQQWLNYRLERAGL